MSIAGVPQPTLAAPALASATLLEPVVSQMPESAIESLAVQRRREESSEQTKLVKLLAGYLDRPRTFWTSLETKPISAVTHQKRRGARSGLPDVLVMYRRDTDTIVIFIELKSPRGLASSKRSFVWKSCRSKRSGGWREAHALR
jgi:hypothetical protein